MNARILALSLVSLATVSLSGCTPSVSSVSVTPGTDVNLVNVEANISDAPAASMGTPKLRVASLAQNPPVFQDAGGFTSSSGAVHRKEGLALPPGQFRVEVQQPYTPVFTSGTQTVSKTADFTVAIPQGCFFFDGGNADGWTADGFFELQTTSPTDNGTRANLCAGQSPFIAATGPNFPQNFTSPIPTAFRSLAMPVLAQNVNACFSQPAPAPQSGFVVVDLISPDLTTVPGWSNAKGFEVQMKGANPAVLTNPNAQPIRAQLLLQDAAGTFFRPLDAQNRPTFVDLGGTFAAASFVSANTTPSRVRVRLFVPSLAGAPPGAGAEVDIDRVCPKS
jgi:hypothetical protein